MAGVSAAVAAAREGASVALVERYGFMGGQATGGLVIKLCSTSDGRKMITRGICKDIVDRLRLTKSARGYPLIDIDPEALKYQLDLYTEENGIQVILHALAVGAVFENRNLHSIIIESKSGREVIAGTVFIDATGDADTARWCNLDFEMQPRESVRPTSLVYTMCNVDIDTAAKFMRSNKRTWKALRREARTNGFSPEWMPTTQPGHVWMDDLFVEGVDGTSRADLQRAEVEGRRKTQLLSRFYAERMPGFEEAFLAQTASQIGVRETRRILGRYVLGVEDLQERKSFPDSIGRANNPYHGAGVSFQIPLRCLLPRAAANLLVAGRCISVQHEILDYIRDIPVCMVTGQGAGTAAALACDAGGNTEKIQMKSLQKALEAAGALI